MGIVFRQSVKTTLVVFAGALLGALTIYLSTWLISDQGYGFSKNILAYAVVISQIALAGMHTMLYVFIYKYPPNDIKRRVLIALSIVVPLLFTTLLSVIYFLLKSAIIDLFQHQDRLLISRFFIWLPVYSLLWAIMTLLEQYLSSLMKVAASTFVREIVLRILNIVLVILVGYNYISFDAFIITSVLIHIIPIAILWYLSTKTEGFGLSFKWQLLSKKEYKEIADFAFYHLLVNASIILLIHVDMLMLGILDKKGMISVAIYSVAIYVISIFQIPYRSMASASTPMINKAFENNQKEEVKDLFNRSGINIAIVSSLMALLIVCNMHNLVQILNTTYAPVLFIVPVLLIGRLADAFTGLNSEILSISRYYRYNFYITLFLLLFIVSLNYYLIPKYGVIGAAWSNTAGFCLYNIFKLLIVRRKLALQPVSMQTIKVLLLGLPVLAIGYYLPHIPNPYTDTIIRSTCIVAVFVIMLLWLQPSPDIKNYLRSVKENKRLF